MILYSNFISKKDPTTTTTTAYGNTQNPAKVAKTRKRGRPGMKRSFPIRSFITRTSVQTSLQFSLTILFDISIYLVSIFKLSLFGSQERNYHKNTKLKSNSSSSFFLCSLRSSPKYNTKLYIILILKENLYKIRLH